MSQSIPEKCPKCGGTIRLTQKSDPDTDFSPQSHMVYKCPRGCFEVPAQGQA